MRGKVFHPGSHDVAPTPLSPSGAAPKTPKNSSSENKVSKRKKDGVFYTPAYITKYIVENTVGKLCEQKKNELGITEDLFIEKRRNKKQQTALAQTLKIYRDWLLSLKICDPACGSGAFLNAALRFLKAEHALIDEMNAKIYGDALIFQEVDNAILENNLFGVDINDESVEIAKLSLWLHTAQKGRKLSTLNNNIKCGNSLIDDESVAGDKAFNWQKEFPAVFANGGFDVVIGNPPYVFAREKVSEQDKIFYAKNYESAKYQINTYILFMEKSVKLSKTNAFVGLIIPNSWLMVYSGEALRKYYLENVKVDKIINLLGKIFIDAGVETVITILENRKADSSSAIEVLVNNEDKQNFELLTETKQEQLKSNNGYEFKIFANSESNSLINKIKVGCIGLDEIACVKAGLQAYEKGKGIPKQTVEDVKKRPYDFNYKYNEDTYKYLDGANVLRYGINWTGLWLWYGKQLAAPRTFDLFSGEKIIIREITSDYPHCLNATYTDELYLYNRSNIAVVKRNGQNVSLKYILTILDSTLMSFYFKKNTAKAERKLFPKVILNDLRLFPIKNIPLSEQQPFITLADKMLSLNSDLQKSAGKFISRLKDNLKPAKISTALETFYNLEFADFVKELGKQKVRLTLKQQDEWEDYFADYKKKCTSLQEQIAATDNEINTQVYRLYGLTDDEIATVEAI